MAKGLLLWCALIALLISATGRSAMAQDGADVDPEALAARCIEHIEAEAKRCVDANAESCERCVAAIRQALEAGNEERALRIARACRRLINHRTDACITRLVHHCRRCVALLERLGADELAARVKAACESVIERVNASRRDALQKIADALGDLPGAGDGEPTAAAVTAHRH